MDPQEYYRITLDLYVNHKHWVITYQELLLPEVWNAIIEESEWEGTGGDWRHIGLIIDRLFRNAIEMPGKEWHSDYVPNSIPPIALRMKDRP